MSWVTGTAGWMYRAIMEYIIGIRAVKNGLLVSPCFPKTWDNVQVKRIFRGATYHIEFIRSQKAFMVVDGVEIEGNILPIGETGGVYNVTVHFN
jgi:cellobiose phosphorylase